MRWILVCWLLGWSWTGAGQSFYTLSGRVVDGATGETLPGVNIYLKDHPTTGTTSNAYGFYSLTLPAGNHEVVYQFIGYTTAHQAIALGNNVTLDVRLGETVRSLEAVTISEEAERNVTDTRMSVNQMNMKEVAQIPVLLGEKDVLKTISLLPGVKSAGEGNAGFYVRGGGSDQNQILLDEANVYNPSHFLGFFSIFNSDALKDVTLYKGGIPAQYGGRISSVLDVKMNDGNNRSFHTSGGIGLISSRLNVEGPLVKDKGSFIVSARRTYADLFLKLSKDPLVNKNRVYFYDFNLKANYELTKKDKLYLSGYFGKDKFVFNDNFEFQWSNTTGTVRWNHVYNGKVFQNTSAIFSDYNYYIGIGIGPTKFNVQSAIRDYSVKSDIDFFVSNKHAFKGGFITTYHTFVPGDVSAGAIQIRNFRNLDKRYAWENAAYGQHEWTVSEQLKVNYGLRISNFNFMGPTTTFSYDGDGNVVDSAVYQHASIIKTYNGLEPRVSVQRTLSGNSSFKLSYNRIFQYMHLLSNTTTSSPTDLWVPSSNNVKPQIGDQVAAGYFRNFRENRYEASAEVYYKYMQNQIDYKYGAELRLNRNVESELLYGHGRAYGLELFVKRRATRLTGWISYTLSRTERQFAAINWGRYFPARQDRRHDVAVVAIYQATPRLSLSSTFIYYTGNAVTFPSGRYVVDGQVVNYYTERNGYRMPAYHRMDLGATWVAKKTDRFESSLTLSVYNVYNRHNAYQITFRPAETDPTRTEAVKLFLFPIIPSITYNFKFL